MIASSALSLLSLSVLLVLAPLPSASAAPSVVYPVADQLPPLAYVSYPFNFTLLQSTFDSPSSLSFSATGLPRWLAFSPESLTFAGVPTGFDAGDSLVSLVATDSNAESTSTSFTLSVLTASPPILYRPLASQLSNTNSISSATVLPSNSGVLIHPYYSFSLGFVLSTVLSPSGSSIFYSAFEASSTSLPSWMSFDNRTATFNGVAPASGSWDIVLAGGERYGTGATRDTLRIEVGTHSLDLVESGLDEVVGIAGSEIVHALNLDGLKLDGATVSRADISASVQLQEFQSWLSFDSSNLTLIGTPPRSFANGTVVPILLPVTLTSASTSAALTTTLPVSIVPYPFSRFFLPNVTTTTNSSVNVSVLSYLVNRTSTLTAEITPATAASWLFFDADTGSLNGRVPSEVIYSSVQAVIRAVDPTTNLGGTLAVALAISGAGVTPSSLPSSLAGSSLATHGPTAGASGLTSSGLSTLAKILIGSIVGGILAAVLLALLILFCCARRRRSQARARALASQHQAERPYSPNYSGGDASRGDGMRSVDLNGDDRNPYAPPPALGSIHQLSSIHLGNGVPIRSPSSPRKDKPRRLDMMRGFFGLRTDADSPPALESEKDLAALQRRDSDASFFSGADPHGLRDGGVTPGYPDALPSSHGHEFGDDAGGLDPEVVDRASIGTSPTFSSEGAQSRASWESGESYRWEQSGDVGASTRGQSDYFMEDPGAAELQEQQNAIRSRASYVNHHTPTSAVFPAHQLAREDSNRSEFADASTQDGGSYPRGLVASDSQQSVRLVTQGGPVAAPHQLRGIASSQSYGSVGSVTSPLARFGDHQPGGFPIVTEEEEDRTNSDLHTSSSSHSDDHHQNGRPSQAQDRSPRPSLDGMPPLPSNAHSSRSRPSPRLIPSRERVPTLSFASSSAIGASRYTYLSPGDDHRDRDDHAESFADADEDEMRARQQHASQGEFTALGYPSSSALYFSAPPAEPFSPPNPGHFHPSGLTNSDDSINPPPASSTIRVIQPSPSLAQYHHDQQQRYQQQQHQQYQQQFDDDHRAPTPLRTLGRDLDEQERDEDPFSRYHDQDEDRR